MSAGRVELVARIQVSAPDGSPTVRAWDLMGALQNVITEHVTDLVVPATEHQWVNFSVEKVEVDPVFGVDQPPRDPVG